MKSKLLIILLVGIVLIVVGAYLLLQQTPPTAPGPQANEVHDHNDPTQDHSGHEHHEHAMDHKDHDMEMHDHGTIEIPEDEPVPSVELAVTEDTMGGYNIEVITENFRFAPENSSKKHKLGEGHAHLYVDGEKIGRVYGRWYYLGALEPGEHEIRVNLNGNDHSAFAVDGNEIDATVTVNTPEPETGEMDHSHHQPLILEASANDPSVKLDITKDPKSGWNIYVEPTNFALSARTVGEEHTDGQGHAHLFVDGKKLTRLYGYWYHIDGLEPGEHNVEVTLNANTHQPIYVEQTPIADLQTIYVK